MPATTAAIASARTSQTHAGVDESECDGGAAAAPAGAVVGDVGEVDAVVVLVDGTGTTTTAGRVVGVAVVGGGFVVGGLVGGGCVGGEVDGAGFVGAGFVGAGFVGAGFVGAGFVGAGFVGADVVRGGRVGRATGVDVDGALVGVRTDVEEPSLTLVDGLVGAAGCEPLPLPPHAVTSAMLVNRHVTRRASRWSMRTLIANPLFESHAVVRHSGRVNTTRPPAGSSRR
jgi:hypothetical protein